MDRSSTNGQKDVPGMAHYYTFLLSQFVIRPFIASINNVNVDSAYKTLRRSLGTVKKLHCSNTLWITFGHEVLSILFQRVSQSSCLLSFLYVQ